jgi:hypothetical protein
VDDTLRLCLFSQEARRLVSRVIAFGENGNKYIDVIGINLSYLGLCVLLYGYIGGVYVL